MREVVMCIILGCIIGLLILQVAENIRVSFNEDDADEQDKP